VSVVQFRPWAPRPYHGLKAFPAYGDCAASSGSIFVPAGLIEVPAGLIEFIQELLVKHSANDG